MFENKQLNFEKKEYIIISHLISLVLMGMIFIKSIFVSTNSNYFLYSSFILIIFSLSYFMAKYLKNVSEDISLRDNYLIFISYVVLITLLIYNNTNFNRHLLKIAYIIPLVLFAVNFRNVFNFFAAGFCGFNIIILNYLLNDFSSFAMDMIIIIIFYWVSWLIGGFKEIETRARQQLEESLEKSRTLTRELDKVNQTLAESQRLFRLNFDESHIGMAIFNTKGKIIKVNKALCRALGYDRKKIKGQKLSYFLHPDGKKEFKDIFYSLLESEDDTANFEKKYIDKDDNIVWLNHNITLAKDDKDEPLYFLSQLENITEKKVAEQKIKEQREELEYNKLRTKFFARLSHEFKTPLNLIFSSLKILNLEHQKYLNKEGKEKATKYTGLIEQNSYRLLRLVNNVIDLTKLDMDFFDINKGNYDIISIIKKVTFSTEDYIINQNKILKLNTNVEKKIIACDPFNIERVMLNLLSNAIKFTNPGDEILVDIYEEDKNIVIIVEDTGIGIKKEMQDLIFDQFRQADESFTRNNEGSGIGLSIVKSLVELHEGDIRVESKVGEGSKFIINLPIKTINEEENRVDYTPDNLIDKISVEFSDIYE